MVNPGEQKVPWNDQQPCLNVLTQTRDTRVHFHHFLWGPGIWRQFHEINHAFLAFGSTPWSALRRFVEESWNFWKVSNRHWLKLSTQELRKLEKVEDGGCGRFQQWDVATIIGKYSERIEDVPMIPWFPMTKWQASKSRWEARAWSAFTISDFLKNGQQIDHMKLWDSRKVWSISCGHFSTVYLFRGRSFLNPSPFSAFMPLD